MFRRYPYWGWLALGIALWCINGFQYRQHTQSMLPERLSQLVTNDLHHREAVFEKFLADEDLLTRLFTDSLSEKDFTTVSKLPFYVYCYDEDTLISWNTNVVVGSINDTAYDKTILLSNDKGVFLEKCIRPFAGDTIHSMVILFPVVITYPLENTYLKSHYPASASIPVKTRILPADQHVAGAYPVALQGSTPAMYMQFNLQDLQKWMPDTAFILLLFAALIVSLSWVQFMIIHFTQRTTPMRGLLLTVVVLCLLLLLYYGLDLPFNLSQITFFDSQLYASDRLRSSLADIFVIACCLLWLVVFITRHTPYRSYFSGIKKSNVRLAIGVGLALLLYCYVNFFVVIIRDLVRDSRISFDVSHFYAITLYSVLGLLVIACIACISCFIIYLFHLQLRALVPGRLLRYALLAAMGCGLVVLKGNYHDPGTLGNPFNWTFYWVMFCWVMVFVVLLDIRRLYMVADLLKPRMVIWAVFICTSCTGALQYFNRAKEREERISRISLLKSSLSPQRDYELEFSFNKKAERIGQDKLLKSYFYKPTQQSRRAADQHFNTTYLTDPAFARYQPQVYFFDANEKALFNKDTLSYEELLGEKTESDLTNSPYLFYKEGIHDQHFYLSYIPLYNDTVNNVIGHVVIDLDLKKQVSGTVYPELLQSGNAAGTQDNGYAIAVYVNDKLVSQTNDYPFKTYLKNDTLKKDDPIYVINDGTPELYYKLTDKRTLAVVYNHNELLEVTTLFSYLFVMLVVMGFVVLLYQLYQSGRWAVQLTLKRRVHFSMLGLVLLSFVFIGSATIFYFKYQYNLSNEAKLQSAMQLVKQGVQDDLAHEHANNGSMRFDTVTRSMRFKSVITGMANSQKIDLNIYNRKGLLVNTSEDDIYEKGLVSRIMRPEAYYQLNDQGKSILIQEEKIADLSYLSAYLPLIDDMGVTTGYINVPFFASQKDLNYQISTIVVTLINIYAFIFLVSGLLTLLITNWITKSFNLIIEQFSKVNLRQNERIKWPYDDEIGKLVNEYNKMVLKVEENAARLAQSERETAWREMARQVAHEIKNPLTPMKLNIQFLQQAMRNDNPKIKELTEKVSCSIIEQIDNLSYIASEFSNFAKMPEARPEVVSLGELLGNALKLYVNDAQIKVAVHEGAAALYVYSDRSQLLRVFTNLLENAKQSIPEGREGAITVTTAIEDGYAVLAIQDNGVGINEEVAEKIFQPYFTTKSSGTGLGLAMTKKIIEFWKGEIWFETKEGIGTTFFIKLPLHQP